jgi:hypothetical protein
MEVYNSTSIFKVVLLLNRPRQVQYLEAKPVERKNKWFAIVNRQKNITIQRNLTVWLYSVVRKLKTVTFVPLLERNQVNSSLIKGRQPF